MVSIRILIAVVVLLIASIAWAGQPPQDGPISQAIQPAPLPDPLTLSDAILLASDQHPSLQRVAADRALADARLDFAGSRYQWESHISLDARSVVKASSSENDFHDDSRATLYLSKVLSDFGQGRASLAAARTQAQGAGLAQEYKRVLHEIDIMRRYFDVQLSDLRYYVDDEDMTLSFLRYDRIRDRRERFEEFSEVDEKELEAVFRNRFVTRTKTANQQRRTRNRLALAMGRPGELADHIVNPELSAYDRPIPDYDELLAEVLKKHPAMKISSLLLESADHTIRQYELMSRPELTAEFQAAEYALKLGNGKDQYRAGLRLDIPLGSKPIRRAKLAEVSAERYRIAADRGELEFGLRQEVLELVQTLRELELEQAAAKVNESYRDLYLDRSRTLYQLEVRTDLGDSQARQAEAVWRSSKVKFEKALTWARIDAMRGMPPLAILQNEDSQ